MTCPAAALASLKPRERVLLRLKALIGPAATGKTVFVECLNRVSSGVPGWSHATLAPTLQALRAQGLLTEDLTCAPELLHPLAVEAIDSAEGAAMVEAIRAKLPLDNPQVWDRKLIEDASLRWQRLAVLVNDEEEFQQATNYRHRYSYSTAALPSIFERHFAAVDVGVDWFASRRPAFQVAILAAKADRWIATGVEAPGYPALMDLCRRVASLRAAHYQRLTNFELLAGRLGRLDETLADVPEGTPPDVAPAFRASRALLAGEPKTAVALFAEALKLYRKGVRKRKGGLRVLSASCTCRRCSPPTTRPSIPRSRPRPRRRRAISGSSRCAASWSSPATSRRRRARRCKPA